MRRNALVALLTAAIIGVAAIGIVLTRGTRDVVDEPQATDAQQEVDRAVRNLMGTFNLTRQEAERYLELNGRLDDAREALAAHIPAGRLFGTWVEYKPEWKFVIALRGPAPPPTALSEAVAHAPVPVEIRLDPGSPEDQLWPILEAELRERAGSGYVSKDTIHLLVQPPAGATMEESLEFAAALKAELEAKHGVRFEVLFGAISPAPLSA